MRQLKAIFQSRLTPWYDAREISSLLEWSVCHTLGWSRTQWFLAQSETLASDHRTQITTILERLEHGEPIQYIIGETEFCGNTFRVTPSVLIPRPETEELVHLVAQHNLNPHLRILDIGTGSGAIAISLSLLLPKAEIEAWDISSEALAIAQSNNDRLGARVTFQQMDILNLETLPSDPMYDIIVSNPPYITISEKKEMKRHVLDYEPHLALFVDDNDPLLFYKKIGTLGHKILNKQGLLFLEINEQYGAETIALLSSKGFRSIHLQNDLNGRPRMISAINE